MRLVGRVEQLADLLDGNLLLADVAFQCEYDAPVVIAGLADVVGVACLENLSAQQLALSDLDRLGQVRRGLRLARERLALFVELRCARRKLP